MPTVFIRGDYDVTLKQGTVLVKPRVRRKMIRDSVRSMKERKKTLSLVQESQQVETAEEHRMSVKYMEHLFVSTRSRVTGPALAFLSKAGVPVTFMEDGEISHEILPSSSHGSPGARMQQVIDSPPLARHKNRAFTKAMFRQLASLVDKTAPDLRDKITDLRGQLIQAEVEPHKVRGIVERIRDSCVQHVRWARPSTGVKSDEGSPTPLDEGKEEVTCRSSQSSRVDGEESAPNPENRISNSDESTPHEPKQLTSSPGTDLRTALGIARNSPVGKTSRGGTEPRRPRSTATNAGYKYLLNEIILHLIGDDPPRSRPQVIREAESILQSVIRYQIILSGLLPLAGGYITTLSEDIYNELAIPVVYIPLLRVKHANGYRKEVLRRIDDRNISLRRRILKGAMTYAKHCRESKELTTPALVKIPQEMIR